MAYAEVRLPFCILVWRLLAWVDGWLLEFYDVVLVQILAAGCCGFLVLLMLAVVVVQVQPIGEVEVAEEQGCAPGGSPEGQNEGEGELHQPSVLPASHQEQLDGRWQAQAYDSRDLRSS